MSEEKTNYNQEVPAVAQGMRLLFAMADANRGDLTLTELAAMVGIHKSKGYSILNTLSAFGVVTRNQTTKTYSLGPGLLSLSKAFLDTTDIRRTAEPYLKELAEKAQSTALLGLFGKERLTIVGKEEYRSGIGVTIRVGHNYPLTWGAHGRLLEARAKKYDPSIDTEFAEIRKNGFAKDLGGMQRGINAAAALVSGFGDQPIACVITVGTFPEETVDRIGRMTVRTAKEIGKVAARR